MNYKKLMYFIITILSIAIASVFLHELVHIFQFHYFYGAPLEDISLHFFWEFNTSGLSLKESILSYPAAWIHCKNISTLSLADNLFLEIPAYTIQYSFITFMYFKFINKNDKLNWKK